MKVATNANRSRTFSHCAHVELEHRSHPTSYAIIRISLRKLRGNNRPDRSTLTLRSPLSFRASATLRVCHGSMTRAYATAYAPPPSAATERTTGNERGLSHGGVFISRGAFELKFGCVP
jgi:hypothetical protein